MINRLRDWLHAITARERDCWRFKYEAEHEYAQRLEGIQRDTYTNYLNTMGELAVVRGQLEAAHKELAAYDRAISTGTTVAEARVVIEAETRAAEIETQRARQAREDEEFYGGRT